jgi:hypothetical protein
VRKHLLLRCHGVHLRAAKHSLKKLRQGAGLNLLQIEHPLACQEAASYRLQPYT